MSRAIAFIGLGSNLNNPLQQVTKAIAHLQNTPGIHLLTHSPWYGSRAIGPGLQADYINGVAKIETELPPLALLDALQAIELQQHRQRLEHWGPRTLDLDLLLYNQDTLNHPRLTLPHPYLTQRAFVVVPLYTLAPQLILPNGEALAAHYNTLSQAELWLHPKATPHD